MSRRLYSDITIQSQNIDNWQIKRGSSEIGHTVKIQPHYTGSPQGSRSLLRIPGLGIADGILVQPLDIGSRCYMLRWDQMLGLGYRNKKIVIHGNWMTGMLISKNFENVGPMIAIYSQFSSGLLTSFIFENKKSVRKAAYFYTMLKKCQIWKKSIMDMDRWKQNYG